MVEEIKQVDKQNEVEDHARTILHTLGYIHGKRQYTEVDLEFVIDTKVIPSFTIAEPKTKSVFINLKPVAKQKLISGLIVKVIDQIKSRNVMIGDLLQPGHFTVAYKEDLGEDSQVDLVLTYGEGSICGKWSSIVAANHIWEFLTRGIIPNQKIASQ